MKRSTDRILTSHAGSLHGTPELIELTKAQPPGEAPGPDLADKVKQAVKDVVRLQQENGVDVVNDGEYTKGLGLGWMTYARARLGGIEIRPLSEGERAGNQSITAREEKVFPDYFKDFQSRFGGAGGFARTAVYAAGPLTYVGQDATRRDIDYLKAAMQGANVEEGFLSALAPGTIEHWLRNQHYKTEEEMVFAIADAMHEEYKMIADAGLIVQLDDPGLPDGYMIHADMSVADYRRFLEVRIEATNHSIRDIPEEQVRLHMCWGSFHHPHTQDIPLAEIIDLVYKVKAQCYSIEAANPQHEHEWTVFKDHPLPDGKILMPGILGHCAREFVDHPEALAQRFERYASVVGKENVIGGTDCGLSRVAHPSIMWAKFKAMSDGAAIATKRLWGR
ncbi:MAG TPA: cobalamin-independent methionine synthase II family protein [Dehalococcoidia bacterium]|jgi:5-methyltetrahydropteroyltriglutamate--homocysteine methyltransferase|nr:cobalamin-independent methionine synthase II family protein [Dehalococcoidia bacterium]